MGELRKDYFLDEYVIISPERAKRPHDFVQHPTEAVKSTPFTPGNESMLPPIVEEHPKGSNWRFRVIPNKFAIVRPEGQQALKTDKLYTFASNYGYHEIVIEGQQDGASFVDLGASGISEAISIAIGRVKLLEQKHDVNYVAYFKNERPEAGASINHPHSQIVALGVVPKHMQEIHAVHANLRKNYGFSPLYKILDNERGSSRMITETKHFAVLCPYASKFPFEVMIVPIRDSHSYTTMTADELADLGKLLSKVLSKLKTITAPFNIQWYTSKTANGFHWYVSVTPRLNIWAGLELQTGIIVNPVPPEHAAAFYRE